MTIAFNNATITWPQDRGSGSTTPSAPSTPKHKFVLIDLTLKFPEGTLSLICGRVRFYRFPSLVQVSYVDDDQ